ncbi:MAG: UDP-N-acetylmuramate dehydrogenase [Prevotellaceae bacterium]|nr:UDP-N-acetylmuramate dehydrogenase [Prevotellaceae bacterium]
MIKLSNISLLPYNTFGIDVNCKTFIEYESLDELTSIIDDLDEPYLHIGQGSNLLFTKDFEGTILHSAIKGIEVVYESGDEAIIEVGSGETWDDVVAFCVTHGYYGAENLSLIPGEMGAAAVQNIGAYGAEVKDIIETVFLVHKPTGRLMKMHANECKYAYRSSIFKKELKGQCFVYKVALKLSKTFTPHLEYGGLLAYIMKKSIPLTKLTAEFLRETIIEIRNSKLPDPKVIGNAGSFFMNPIVDTETFDRLLAEYPTMPHYKADGGIKIPAGWMIEQCGWKQKSTEKAGVYEHQALVLINKGGASGADVLSLCNAIIKDVKDRFGVEIHPEVNII